jgi:hypothetical protein
MDQSVTPSYRPPAPVAISIDGSNCHDSNAGDTARPGQMVGRAGCHIG